VVLGVLTEPVRTEPAIPAINVSEGCGPGFLEQSDIVACISRAMRPFAPHCLCDAHCCLYSLLLVVYRAFGVVELNLTATYRRSTYTSFETVSAGK
jgi:hypothetical protein